MTNPKPLLDALTVHPTPIAVLDRPQLGSLIACIASLSGALERYMAGILSDVMETHSKQALAMYLALSGSQARKSALLAAARLRISKDDYSKLVKLYDKIGKTASERNDVIHGAWAVHGAYPNALLLCDPSVLVQFEAAALNIARYVHSNAGTDMPEVVRRKALEIQAPKYLIYTEEDFNSIAHKIADLLRVIQEFRRELQAKYHWQVPEPDSDPKGM